MRFSDGRNENREYTSLRHKLKANGSTQPRPILESGNLSASALNTGKEIPAVLNPSITEIKRVTYTEIL